ncbi:MAG: hypothetical protein ACYC4Q_12445 [Victivallaceae bacterium]
MNSRGTPYCQYKPVWLWYNRYDFAQFDQQIHDVCQAMPDADFICMIDLNSPAWLEHQLITGGDSFNNLGKAVHNPRWLNPTTEYLKDFLRYAEAKYSDRIKAYVLACGVTDEWLDYSFGTDDSTRTVAWNQWRQKHNLESPVDIPPESVRRKVTHDEFLRDPQCNRMALDYWKFCNESIADTIVHFAHEARKIIRQEAEIGAFYGYILEISCGLVLSGGCLEYERVLAAPEINFLISPGTYTDRQIGGGSGFMIPNGTVRRYGKQLLHECDQRTHTYNPYLTSDITMEFEHWPDEKSTVAGIKREAALALIKQTSLWWFDQWGDFYQGENIMNLLAKIKNIWTEYADMSAGNLNEIALIVDPGSTYYFDENRINGNNNIQRVHQETRNWLNRIGAPFEVFSFNDIPMVENFDDYKFIIFNSSIEITSEKMEILQRCVLKNNRVILWLYAPGASDGITLDFDRCEKLTGVPFKTPDLQICEKSGWTSAYLYAYSDMNAQLLKNLARKAGVNIYCEAEQAVYANSRLLAIHTAEGGIQKITLPCRRYNKVTEVFSSQVVAVNSSEFEYDFKIPDTALFELYI